MNDDNAVFYHWLRIKRDWSAFPSYYFNLEKNSYFGGREEKVDRLSYWLADGGGGSVLISGVRGIGKTAFVYHSIREIYEHNRLVRFFLGVKDTVQRKSDFLWYLLLPVKYLVLLVVKFVYHFNSLKKITVVPINAATIDPARLFLLSRGKDERELYNQTQDSQKYLFWQYMLLQQLITALHFSKVRSWILRKRIASLYRWSISEGSDTQSMEIKGGLGLGSNWLEMLTPYLLAISAVGFVAIPSWITGIILAILGSLKLSQSLSKIRLKEIKIKSNNFDYLYSELNSILNGTRGEIFIFVVDELDKVEDREDILKPYSKAGAKGDGFVDLFIRSFKNLVTITSGRFVFITSEKYYMAWSMGRKGGHPENSTFFGWDLYLSQASVVDIVKYLELICIDKSDHAKSLLKVLAYALYLETGGHYSEIVNKIGTLVRYKRTGFWIFTRNTPHISFHVASYPELVKKARLGKILENVIKQRASENVDRQEFEYYQAMVLHGVLKHILSKKGIIGAGTKSEFINNFIQEQIHLVGDVLSDVDRQIVVSQIHDLLADINNLATGKKSSSLQWVIPPDDNAQVSFDMDIASVGENIDDLPPERRELTDLEARLVDNAENVAVQVKQWLDILGYRLVRTDVEFINMLNSEFTDDYIATQALAKKVDLLAQNLSEQGRVETLDPRDIKKSIDTVESLNKLISNRLFVLGKYLAMLLPGIKTSYGERLVTLQKGNKKVGIVEQMWMAAYSIASNRVNNKTIILSDNMSPKKFNELLTLVINYLDIQSLIGNLENWSVTSADSVKEIGWNGAAREVKFVTDRNSFRRLICIVSASGDYWRFGIALGASLEKLQPLDGGDFTLIHIFKDTDSTVIKWKRVWNKLVRTILTQTEKKLSRSEVVGSHTTQPIAFEVRRLTKKSNFVWVYINGYKTTKVKMPEKDYSSLFLLAWGDGKEFAMEVSSIMVETATEVSSDVPKK